MQEDDLLREPPRLAQVVRDHYHLDAALLSLHELSLYSQSRSRVEICGRLVKEQYVGIKTERSCKAQPLLLPTREHTRRSECVLLKPSKHQRSVSTLGTLAARHATQRKRMGDVANS